jgi:hypothetical protein
MVLIFTHYATHTPICLKQQGVHVTTAQRLLGHSDPRVTMNVYTQVLDNEIDDVGLLLKQSRWFLTPSFLLSKAETRPPLAREPGFGLELTPKS